MRLTLSGLLLAGTLGASLAAWADFRLPVSACFIGDTYRSPDPR